MKTLKNLSPIYYFIGIKGSGMSALAKILHDQGKQVLGSDILQYTFTEKPLKEAGIKILPFDASNIKDNYKIIAGNAFNNKQVEIKAAHDKNVPIEYYHDFLGKLIEPYTSIGVTGTHGKTTTTGLLANVFSSFAPTNYLIGDGTGKGTKNAKFFVYEADEYQRHFLSTAPTYAIITNLEFDHPDYYHGIEDVTKAFNSFASKVKKGIFAWGEDPRLRNLKTTTPIYYYGTNKNDDFRAFNIKRNSDGSEFEVMYLNKNLGKFKIPLYGKHNVLNALAVIAVSYKEGISPQKIQTAFDSYHGVKRRFAEHKVGSTTIIDDYAHHPSEIKATLDAVYQKYPNKKVVAVFQPHTYTRTKAYLDDYATELNKVDKAYVTDIYSSPRETSGNVSSNDLISKLNNSGGLLTESNIDNLLREKGDVVVFMGAGDIQKYEQKYERELKNS